MLLHGFPDSAYLWRHQIPVLVDAGFQVVVPDQRGMGDSSAPEGRRSYAISALTADVIGLMDLLGLEQATVVGHDWGSMVGWFLAMRHPQRIRRYIAVSVGHPKAYLRAGLGQMLRAWYAAIFLIPGLAEKLMPAGNWLILRRLGQPEVGHWIEDLSRPGRLTAGLNWYRANAFALLRQDFSSIAIPTMGVWSTGDSYLSEEQMIGSSSYVTSNWRYERISGAGHWIPIEAAGQLNALLLDFIGQP